VCVCVNGNKIDNTFDLRLFLRGCNLERYFEQFTEEFIDRDALADVNAESSDFFESFNMSPEDSTALLNYINSNLLQQVSAQQCV